MTDLSQNLLAAARQGMTPSADVAARVRARVLASAAAPAPAVATAASIKIGGVLLVVGVLVAAIVVGRGQSAVQAPRVAVAVVDSEQPASREHAAATEAAAPASAPATATAGEPPLPTLAREVELIDRAMLALRNSTPAAALAAIRVFDRETRGHGQLTEDAQAIAIEAHCRLGHDVAGRLAAFDRRWPSSAQRERLQSACR